MHIAFGRVRRKIAPLRSDPFVVGKPFIARQLPIVGWVERTHKV